jgi:hypothetical protein
LAHQRDRLLIPAQEFSRNAAPVEALKPEPEIARAYPEAAGERSYPAATVAAAGPAV